MVIWVISGKETIRDLHNNMAADARLTNAK